MLALHMFVCKKVLVCELLFWEVEIVLVVEKRKGRNSNFSKHDYEIYGFAVVVSKWVRWGGNFSFRPYFLIVLCAHIFVAFEEIEMNGRMASNCVRCMAPQTIKLMTRVSLAHFCMACENSNKWLGIFLISFHVEWTLHICTDMYINMRDNKFAVQPDVSHIIVCIRWTINWNFMQFPSPFTMHPISLSHPTFKFNDYQCIDLNNSLTIISVYVQFNCMCIKGCGREGGGRWAVLNNVHFMKQFYVDFMIFKHFSPFRPSIPFQLMRWRRDFMSLPEIN